MQRSDEYARIDMVVYIKRIDGTLEEVADLAEYDLFGNPAPTATAEFMIALEAAEERVVKYNIDNYEPRGDNPYPGIR